MDVFEGWSAALTAGSAARLQVGASLGQRQNKKGGAAMDHSRLSKLALALLILLALTSIPGTWSPYSTGSWLSVTPAWAGSPDETLKPKGSPAARFVPISLQAQTSAQSRVTTVASPRTQVVTLRTRFEQFALVWRVSLASVLRF
jgi:hypothetical protein